MRRSLPLAVLVLALVALVAPRSVAQAQTGPRCFGETGQCVAGRFREYWEGSGGLPVFGFPLTAAADEPSRDSGASFATQWFERNRFELHPENAAPYAVLLGRLGDDRLRQLGVDWQSAPKAAPGAAHRFAASGHAIAHEPFWQYWSTRGLDLGDPGVSARESLALWGLPLTEPRLERNASGDTVLTQWFERARFEDHGATGVLLGLLGAEVRSGVAGAPAMPAAGSVDYVALGDSLATGVLAQRGYVVRYAAALDTDAQLRANVANLGRIGWLSADLLAALRDPGVFNTALRDAEVVSWNIGGNDLSRARALYKARSCGGADNQDCLRQTVVDLKANWDAILARILAARSPSTTLLVTMDIYNPFVGVDTGSRTVPDGPASDWLVFDPYFRDVNAYLAATAGAQGVKVAAVARAFNGAGGGDDPRARGLIAFDGLHPSDAGHALIASAMRDQGYAPLK